MPEPLKSSIEEQLALYRRRRKEEEERKAQSNRLWNTVLSFLTFGMRNTDSPSSLSTSSDVSEDKSEMSSEENDKLSFKESTSGVQKRRGGHLNELFGRSTHYSDVEPPSSSSSSFCSSYTTLDWVALGLKCLMWLIMFKVFIIIEFGAVYFIFSAFIFIWYNMRSEPKKKGEISAYSVFNPDCKSIDGTFTAEQFERELLHKM